MILTLIVFVLGLALGAGALAVYRDRKQKADRHIPKVWPLTVRALVNSHEKQVWLWLHKVMFDQQIAIKLPVTRFTAPAANAHATRWYHLLNGVYCTFTVSNLEGQVIGCIDVLGPQGLSLSNQTLKHNLLTHCGIHYFVLDPNNLPHLMQIRTAMLGEQAARVIDQPSSGLDSQIKDVREYLHATVERKRHSIGAVVAQPDVAGPDSSSFGDSHEGSDWQQNSFVVPLDSRRAPLDR